MTATSDSAAGFGKSRAPRRTLLLFTGSYPYDVAAENGFIPQELELLRRSFEKVFVIPTATGGARESITAPNVVVNTDYASFTHSNVRRALYALRAVFDPAFARELVSNVRTWLRHPRAMVSAMHAHVVARMTERWMETLNGQVRWNDAVLYTWWFDGTTLGLARFAQAAAVPPPVITRAHGVDLYESRHHPPYIPFRRTALELITQLFSASAAGARHLQERYKASSGKIRVGLLGVDDPGFLNQPSRDDVFRIASCSLLLPVKRIDLMIHGIAALGRAEAGRRFEWTHIGVGPEKEGLAALAQSTMPANVRWELRSYAGKADLYDVYRSRPIDLFVNTSRSEGTPVAVMEAISVGIPVLATAVGGNTEIVGQDNGVLIPADAEPSQIASAIGALVVDRARLTRLRAGSREKWRTQYSADRNYGAFAQAIRAL